MTDAIKYRPDGSIDTDHYMRTGRRLRGEQAIKLFAGGTRQDRCKRWRFRNIFAFI